MRELMQTNDAVLLSYVGVLLEHAGIAAAVLDGHMSIAEGSLAILPRRVLVEEEDWASARSVLEGAGLGVWMSQGAGEDD
jgi:hypothetical protein